MFPFVPTSLAKAMLKNREKMTLAPKILGFHLKIMKQLSAAAAAAAAAAAEHTAAAAAAAAAAAVTNTNNILLQ
jgi:hypothetical protein